MKKLKYAMPLAVVSIFPFYWGWLSNNMMFLSDNPGTRNFAALMIILFLGFFSTMVISMWDY